MCLKQAKINCRLNKIESKRYRIFQADVFKGKPASAKSFGVAKYDFILANPPYIPTTRKSEVGKSVLKYEPKQALFGGKDGMKYIKKFLSQAKKHLKPNGKIFMEFDYIQKKGIERLLKQYGYNSPAGGWQFYKDQYGKYRWVATF
jgi:release factor glutamine methyltransferase